MPKAINNHPLNQSTFHNGHLGIGANHVPSNISSSNHRRATSDSTSDWSSDSSRSRSSQFSQQGGSLPGFGFDASLDGGIRNLPPSSSTAGLPASWNVPNGGIDQSTLTPNQVRAVYGGSLPVGYSHPSQYANQSQHPGSITLPNPASGLVDSSSSYSAPSYVPSSNTGTSSSSWNNPGSNKLTLSYPHSSSSSSSKLSSGTGAGGYDTNATVPSQSSSGLYGSTGSFGAANGHGASGGGMYQANNNSAGHHSSSHPSHDGGHYNYDPMTDFSNTHNPQALTSTHHNTYPMQAQKSSSSTLSNPAPNRPSLPGLDSFMSATFPTTLPPPNLLNGSTIPNHASSSSSAIAPSHPFFYSTRNNDRRGSVASTTSLSDSVGTSSSLMFAPSSPSDTGEGSGGSRPGTASSSISGFGLGNLQLRGAEGGSPDSGSVGSGSAAGSNVSDSNAGSGSGHGEVENGKLRQLWSSWLATPFSSASDKEGGNPFALGTPSSASQGLGQQGSFNIHKTMSLPSISRTPNTERRNLGMMGNGADMQTPRAIPPGRFVLFSRASTALSLTLYVPFEILVLQTRKNCDDIKKPVLHARHLL